MPKKARKSKGQQLVRLSTALLVGMMAFPAQPQAQAGISCFQTLDFGSITTCGSAGTVTVTPNNGRSTTGCLSTGGAPHQNGVCIITTGGLPTNFSVAVPASISITNAGTNKMVVNNLLCKSGSVNCNFSTTAFTTVLPIGADLNVGNPQAAGSYSGSFTVTVTP